MDDLLEIGAIIVVVVIGVVLWSKYGAAAAYANNAQAIASANRSNAWTSLGVSAGQSVIDGLNNYLQPGYGTAWGN